MTTWLNKIFNVRPGEWTRVLFFSAIFILTTIVETWATTVTYAKFLKTAGLDDGLQTLVWVMVLSSILSIVALSIYSIFVDRVDNNRLFIYVLMAGAAAILLSMVLVQVNLPKLAFPLLYILSEVLMGAVWGAQFSTYLNEVFDIQSIKRTLPLILAVGRIGAALGGFSLGFITKYLGTGSTEKIIWIWFLSHVLVIGVVWVMPFFLKEQKKIKKDSVKPGMPEVKNGESSYVKNLKEGWNFTVQSGFLRWMAVGALLLAALATLLEYYINKVMAPQFSSSVDYAAFLGVVGGISNVVALVILLFIISRMTRAWGIGNTSVVYPAISFFIYGGLIISPFFIPAAFIIYVASLAQINRLGLRSSLQGPIGSLLYNAVPLRIKGRARAFVGGIIGPLGGVAAVLLLLVDLSYGSAVSWLLPSVIALLSVAYLISALAIRSQYTQALVKMLEEEDYSFLLAGETSQLSVADPATLRRLEKKLDESTSHEMRVFMTQLIAQVGGADSLSILIPAIKSANEPRTQAAMLNVVAAAGLQGGIVRELYVDFLADPNAQVRQSAASGLEQLLGAQDVWLQNQWLKMVGDADRQVSIYALQSLAGTGAFYKFESAVQKLDELIKSDTIENKKSAIGVLGIIAQPMAIEHLLVFLADTDDQIRIETILALEKLALPFGGAMDAKILEKTQLLLHDPVARIRQAALQVISKFKNQEVYPLLISALADKNSQVCTAAVDILIGIGKGVTPMAQAELNSEDLQTRKMAAVILSRINPRQFGPLIEKSVSENLNNIYQNISLEQALTSYNQYYSVRVQLAALRESNDGLIDEILYLLSAIHDPQILNVIGESLHSDSSETRNLALEALESLTSPQTAALIASLFEPNMAPLELLQLGQGALNIEQVNIVQALEKLFSQADTSILDLLALHVAADICIDLLKAPIPSDNTEQVMSSGQVENESALAIKIRALLEKALSSPDPLVQQAAQAALQKISDSESGITDDIVLKGESKPLSVIEKMSILKEVPFFRNIPISQLENLALVCQEKKYGKGTRIFKTGDMGGTLYVIVDGQVGIEQEKRGGSTLLATLGNNSYFGEMSIFDNSPRSTSAVVMKDSLILELNRAPVFTLTMQNPTLAFEIINILSRRIRETSDRLADTARARPRELHKLFDQFN